MDKISKEQLATEIASQIKEMGMNGIFNEEFMNKVQESVSSKINNPVLEEEIDLEGTSTMQEDSEDGGVVNTLSGGGEDPNNTDFVPDAAAAPAEDYTPQMPSFLDKIEPDQFVVFDMNELSEGGVNLSNKQFRTFDNPDVKKSIHQCWIEEGKRSAKVYVAKFEEIGDISFDPLAGTSKFEEKRINDISVPGEKVNPYAGEGGPQIMSPGFGAEPNNIDIQGYMKQYIEDALRAQLNGGFQMQEPVVQNPQPEAPMQESPAKKGENLIIADNAQEAIPREGVKTPVVEESQVVDSKDNELKMVELAMDDVSYRKVDAPEGLRESLSNSEKASKLLVSKGSEVQELKYEGVHYYYPVNIISSKKCYVKR